MEVGRKSRVCTVRSIPDRSSRVATAPRRSSFRSGQLRPVWLYSLNFTKHVHTSKSTLGARTSSNTLCDGPADSSLIRMRRSCSRSWPYTSNSTSGVAVEVYSTLSLSQGTDLATIDGFEATIKAADQQGNAWIWPETSELSLTLRLQPTGDTQPENTYELLRDLATAVLDANVSVRECG